MKFRLPLTTASALILAICFASLIPQNVREALEGFKYLVCCDGGHITPLALINVGFALIGLIVLWFSYRKAERWGWVVMLIVVFCLEVPTTVVDLLITMQKPEILWTELIKQIPYRDWIMDCALLLPTWKFFRPKSTTTPKHSLGR